MARPRENRTSLVVAVVLIGLGAWLLFQTPARWGVSPFPFLGFFGLTGLIHLVLAIWVGIDANRHGMNGVLWAILVFFTSVVGLIVYLIFVQSPTLRNGTLWAPGAAAGRPGNGVHHCGHCGGRVQSDFRHCPFCGQSLASTCPHCSQPISPDWKVCPQCAGSLPSPEPPSGGDPSGS